MKSIITLILSLLCEGLYAQTPHLITIAELKKVANCADQACLGSEVSPWNFSFKTTKKGKNNGLEGTQYQYTRPHRNRAFTESMASYWVMSDSSRRVTLTSDNKTWVAGLETDVQQNGFKFIDQKGLFGEEHYVLEEGNLVWHLSWKKPSLLVELEPHTITLYKTTNAVIQSASPVATQLASPVANQSTSNELPHLGGDWDTKYPSMNAGDILKAERQYTSDYDRQHGKQGHTFSRVEKVRIQGKRTGQYRLLTDKRWNESFDMALRTMGFEAFANDRNRLYKREALFNIGGERIWLPIQEVLIKTLENESKADELITLYTVLVSHHDFGGTLHLSFLVNEFAVARTTDTFSTSPELDKPTKLVNTQPSEKVTIRQETVVSKTTPVSAIKKATSGPCGFKWVDWSAVSATEKAAMKKVMVTEHESPTVSLLQFIGAEQSKGNRIQIARHDFFKDGQPGYVVYVDYKTRQNGDKGRVEVFENLGESKLWPSAVVKENLCAVHPLDNGNKQQRQLGVMGEDGQLEEFLGNLFFEQEYAQFLQETKQTASARITPQTPGCEKFVGGKTPEELCLILLKALKTNDKALWMRCMHPATDVENDELSAKRFDLYRECLDENGVTNWPLVVYSRMTHAGSARLDDAAKLNTLRSRPRLEFTYKNGEFVGQLSFASFLKYGDKWLVRCGESNGSCEMHRSMR